MYVQVDLYTREAEVETQSPSEEFGEQVKVITMSKDTEDIDKIKYHFETNHSPWWEIEVKTITLPDGTPISYEVKTDNYEFRRLLKVEDGLTCWKWYLARIQ